jgi:CBS domain containing-hemolysin-like protein
MSVRDLFSKFFYPNAKSNNDLLNMHTCEQSNFNLQIHAEFLMQQVNEISMIYTTDNLYDIWQAFRKTQLTVLPVCDGTIDNIIGFLELATLTDYIISLKENCITPMNHVMPSVLSSHSLIIKNIKNLAFISPNTDLAYITSTMFTQNIKLFVVLDEFGGTKGIITSDTIVAGLYDNYIKSGILYTSQDGVRILDGQITIPQLQKLFHDIPFDNEDTKTLSGVLITYLGNMPNVNDVFAWYNYQCKILEIEDRSIKKVSITPLIT